MSNPEQAPKQEAAKPATSIVSAKVFSCFSPPPTNTIKGTLIPRSLMKRRKRRKISVEVHKTGGLEECIVRVLDPLRKGEKGAVPSECEYDDVEDDTSTVGNVPSVYRDSATVAGAALAGYKAKYRFPIKNVSITGTSKTSVNLTVVIGPIKRPRELVFDSIAEANNFVMTLEKQRAREVERAQTRMMEALKGSSRPLPKPDDQLNLLIEIVSGWNIPTGDLFSSDPYVVCYLGSEEVHRTKWLSKTLDPIWTLKTHSLGIVNVTTKELFMSDGLDCILYDFDNLGDDEKLGVCRVTPQQLYEATGERIEMKLQPPPDSKESEVPGFLAVRCRRADEYDEKFMSDWEEHDSQNVLLGKLKKQPASEDGATGVSGLQSILRKTVRVAKEGPNAGKKELRVRPGPDPARRDETTWMTEEQIEQDYMKESTNWVDAGNGDLGRLFVEVLGCDGLPNLDSGGFVGNKTDAFVSLVYEDTVVRTDVIDDSLAPRWLPWTQRAFIFHIMHSSSQLFLGAFDYDAGINPTDDHDLIGRVSVDLSNLRPDTVYLLSYDLYTTAQLSGRENLGTVTLRLRLEVPDERKLVLNSIEPPPVMYVNAKTRKDFRLIRFTVTGKYDVEKYNMTNIKSYVEELTALQEVLFYIEDAIMTLLLWRGSFPIPFTGLKFPVHSLTAFLITVFLVEHPQLAPSFYFASIAWFFMATNGYRRSTPDAWHHCKSYVDLFRSLVLGTALTGPHSIEPFNNQKETEAYLAAWKKRILDAEETAKKKSEEALKQQEEYAKEMEDVDEASGDISTKKGGISVDPLRPVLYPLQQNLALLCRYIRLVRHIISWEECYISFWITTLCLVLAVVCVFVPWFFLMKWTARLIVWSVFGPWMKLVDVFYVSKLKPLTPEEQAEQRAKDREARLKTFSKARSQARIKRENAAKLKAVKKYLFGKFILRVPILKEDRYRDVPLPQSSATPYKPTPKPLSELAMEEAGYRRTRRPGQHLEGDMIPKAENISFTAAPAGQATAQPEKLKSNAPGSRASESTTSAYVKLGSVVAVGGVITWFAVPFLGSMTHYVLGSSS